MRNVLMMCLVMLAPTSLGALSFTLDSPIQTGTPGGTVTFSGTLFNDDIVDVFLNGASSTLPYSELSVDFTDFFSLVPASLSAGESYDGPIFAVDITDDATPGDYFGSFTIQGGLDENAVNNLATENFQISLPGESAPEPASEQLFGLSLLVLGCVRYWRIGQRKEERPQPSVIT